MLVRYLFIFFISMLPLIELRGTVPYAVALDLPFWPAYVTAVLGNMAPVPFIYLFAGKVLEWGKDMKLMGVFFRYCIKKGNAAGEKLKEMAGTKGIFWGLLLFVAIPLPGTGAWTGTLAASVLNMDFKSSVLAVMIGVVFAGVFMAACSFGVFGIIF
ncbi:MAG: small multi-drug export protein [Lachnospiraceae bacterium]|nr:small multi-drug export protein [Lachnospiraceae bacterium]